MKRWTFSISADGDRLSDARMKLLVDKRIDTTPMSVKEQGFVHPDGQVLPCDVPPPGHKLIVYGKDCLAVLVNTEEPYSQISYERQIPVPEGTLYWKNGEWRPVEDL